MGMDVYGKNPATERGEYFRNNVWWWHPLWDYCLEMHSGLCGQVECGHSNDGDGLDADDARELGLLLLADVESGAAAEYESDFRERVASLPNRECDLCNGTGIRTDEVGVENGYPTRELNETASAVLGRTHGWCDGCGGVGRRLPWGMNYKFTAENVKEFAEFLLDCGGFEIL